MTDIVEAHKAGTREQPVWIFLVTALFFFMLDGGLSSMVSIKALMFFVVGVALAPVVVGGFAYLLLRGAGKWLLKNADEELDQDVKRMEALRIVVMALQIAMTIYLTRLCYQSFIVY